MHSVTCVPEGIITNSKKWCGIGYLRTKKQS